MYDVHTHIYSSPTICTYIVVHLALCTCDCAFGRISSYRECAYIYNIQVASLCHLLPCPAFAVNRSEVMARIQHMHLDGRPVTGISVCMDMHMSVGMSTLSLSLSLSLSLTIHTGHDVCACLPAPSPPPAHPFAYGNGSSYSLYYMVDVTLAEERGISWVACRPCHLEQCAPG